MIRGMVEGRMRIAVGLSGGVDSSVAALLLKRAGHDVVGVTMRLWKEGRYKGGARDACFGPGEADDIATAAAFAEKIGIPHHVIDCADAYEREIVSYFREASRAGLTPNPCVICNARIKFGLLPELAASAGIAFDRFATGHYARITERGGRFALLRAADVRKDQSYFLYRLSQAQLARQMFPLGGMEKSEVRRLATEAGLAAADRPDSQDFYSGDKDELIGAADRPGDVVTTDGRRVARHNISRSDSARGLGCLAESRLTMLLGLTPAGTKSSSVGVTNWCAPSSAWRTCSGRLSRPRSSRSSAA